MVSRTTQTTSDGPDIEEQQAKFSRVGEFSRDLFQGAVTIRPEADPEYPASYFIVTVEASGTVEELAELNDRWHRELRQRVGDCADQYRLALDIQ